MADAAYYRAWRAAHPDYRKRQSGLTRIRRATGGRGDRSKEYAQRASRVSARLGPLFPHLNHGSRISFWEDELRMDLAQEHALAVLEGRDPAKAVAAYRARETNWRFHAVSLIEAISPQRAWRSSGESSLAE